MSISGTVESIEELEKRCDKYWADYPAHGLERIYYLMNGMQDAIRILATRNEELEHRVKELENIDLGDEL